MMRILLLFCSLCIHAFVWSAEPANFMLGEKQFEGVDIYSILQDKAYNYWFATDNGLYVHDGYSFEQINTGAMKSLSSFGLALHENGDIFCFNLNRQVFRIRNKKCEVFFEIPEPGNDITLLISPQHEIVISTSAQIFVLDTTGQQVAKYVSEPDRFLGPGFQITPNEIIFSSGRTDYCVIYQNQKFTETKINFPTNNPSQLAVFRFFKHHHETFVLVLSTKDLYTYKHSEKKFNYKFNFKIDPKFEHVRLKNSGEYLWLSNLLNGVHLFHPNEAFELPLHKETLFKEFFISDFYKDKEGNHLLATFDKGVIVVPNPENPGIEYLPQEYAITKICPGKPGELILGTNTGGLLIYDKHLQVIKQAGNKRIEYLNYWPEEEMIIYDNTGFSTYDRKINKEQNSLLFAVKDISFGGHRIIGGFNIGLFELEFDPSSRSFKTKGKKILNERIYCTSYEARSKCWYVSSSSGLFWSKDLKHFEVILLNGESVATLDIQSTNTHTIASTLKNGILVLENGKIIQRAEPVFNENKLIITKFLIHQNEIIANTQHGIFLINAAGNPVIWVNKSSGLFADKIFDFCLQENQLWIAHSKGLQKVNFENIKKKTDKPMLMLENILVNGKSNQPAHNRLSPEEKKVTFILRSPSLLHRENIRYHYRLLGAEESWNIAAYEDHRVTYSALRPGNYTFEAKAENNGIYSAPIIYSFTILNPFYLRWWFVSIFIVSLALLVFYLFKRQIGKQQEKANQINELHASRLIAIQSQMNPHFIFNSLNSIQDLVLKGDMDNSYSSITRFSNLVRRTLNQSDKDFIEFEEEIKTIELYLGFEKLRFKSELEFSLNTNQISEILIPPMLIQPFIENALLHGLLHKEGQKILRIDFFMKEETLYCVIEDNGIGREHARKIQERQRSGHESFATKAITKRFDILKHFFKEELGVSYEDSSNGTKVTLKIPHRKQF